MDSGELTWSEAQTERFGERLAAGLDSGDVVYLIGQLGAGKTVLARGLARGLGASPREVASPTFAILHEYAGSGSDIVLRHLDLYRLKDDEEELAILGLPGSVSGAPVAVEWPSQALRKQLPPTVEITIETLSDGSRRIRGMPGAGVEQRERSGEGESGPAQGGTVETLLSGLS